jgi:hypothetical protein
LNLGALPQPAIDGGGGDPCQQFKATDRATLYHTDSYNSYIPRNSAKAAYTGLHRMGTIILGALNVRMLLPHPKPRNAAVRTKPLHRYS